jgi:hypothetical protein
MMAYAGEKDSGGIWNFTFWWFALVFLCATQDIAVDGKDNFGLLSDAFANLVRVGFDASF